MMEAEGAAAQSPRRMARRRLASGLLKDLPLKASRIVASDFQTIFGFKYMCTFEE
jgi:hypothetical protein